MRVRKAASELPGGYALLWALLWVIPRGERLLVAHQGGSVFRKRRSQLARVFGSGLADATVLAVIGEPWSEASTV